MSGQNVIPFNPNRRARRAFLGDGTIAMLIFLIFDAMLFAGMVGVFMLTRTAAGAAWPPAGQPWFPLAETAINTAALVVSGALVFLGGRAWEKREARVAPLLLAAVVLGIFFLFFQGVVWVGLIRQGLTLTASQHGNFFYLIVGMHSTHVLAGLIALSVAWVRLKPLRDDEEPRGSLSRSTFSAVRLLWYFVVAIWPALYLCLYL